MTNPYIVCLRSSGEAFPDTDPAIYPGNPVTAVGDILPRTQLRVIARGTREQAEAIASAINATRPALTFEELLNA